MQGACRLLPQLCIAALLAACSNEEQTNVQVPAWAAVAPEQVAEARKYSVPVAFENDLGMRFVLIPAGTFLMGSPQDEEGRRPDETQREIVIQKPFYVGIHEVTKSQYLRITHDLSPEAEIGNDKALSRPAVNISWDAAMAFAASMRLRDGAFGYRPPYEAEWEYACRAGTSTAYWWGNGVDCLGRYANAYDASVPNNPHPKMTRDDGFPSTAPVGSFPPNPWGLYDMHGNAAEWCLDVDRTATRWDSGEYVRVPRAVNRGGAYTGVPKALRSAHSSRRYTDRRFRHIGFRLVSPLPEPGAGER